MTSRFNEMIILGQAKKDKKGDGVNAVLVLMKEIRDFQDKIDACLEAQAIAENREKIAEFDRLIDKMYASLLDIASGGIKSVRKQRGAELPEAAEVKGIEVEKGAPTVQFAESPTVVSAPVVPKM